MRSKITHNNYLRAKELLGWIDKLPYLFHDQAENMPDFIIAGLPKCGTTWLAKKLELHSRVDRKRNPFHKGGEIKYFGKYFHRPIRHYFSLFKKVDPNRLQFDKSPEYAPLPLRKIRLIKHLNRSMKAILCFRDPVTRAFSHAKMDLLRYGKNNWNEISEQKFMRHYRKGSRKYRYETIYSRWLQVFGSNLLVIDQKDISQNPEQVLDRVCRFLEIEVEKIIVLDVSPVNVGMKIDLPDSHRKYLMDLYEGSISFYNKLPQQNNFYETG